MKRNSLLLLAAVAAAVGVAQARAQDVAVATAGPMTGGDAIFGEQMKRGAEMAVKDINEAGGLLGKKLTLEVGDDQCEPKQALPVANSFVEKKVVFVAGHYCSGVSIPASAVYAENNIMQITPASTNPRLTDEADGEGLEDGGAQLRPRRHPGRRCRQVSRRRRTRARRSPSCTTRRPTARASSTRPRRT